MRPLVLAALALLLAPAALPAPAAASPPAGGVGVYLGAPGARRPQALRALAFRRGRPPRRWHVVGRLAMGDDAIYAGTTNSIMSLRLVRGLAAIPLRGGRPQAAIALFEASAELGNGTPAPTRIDGAAPAIQAALRRLPAGEYRLATTFTYVWDEHTDGPTWGSGTREAARGEIPLHVAP